MQGLTPRQQAVLDFIRNQQVEHGLAPSLREIAQHFGFRSMTAAADHVRALRRKGFLVHQPRRARAHAIVSRSGHVCRQMVDIPLYGSIPAGFSDGRVQQVEGCISINVESVGLRSTAQAFALRVRGDSMVGRHILDGDCVIVERGRTPRPGDVVAALIDNESTLKTLVIEKGQPHLRAENSHYPDLIPATELSIQGVMVGLVRGTA